MLLVGILTMLQLLVPLWLSLPLLDLCLSLLLKNLIGKWLTLSIWLGLTPQTFALLNILVCLLWLGCNPLALNSWLFLHLVVFVIFYCLNCIVCPCWRIQVCIKLLIYCFSEFGRPSYKLPWSTLFVAVILVSRSKIPYNWILGCYNLYQFLMGNCRSLVLTLL